MKVRITQIDVARVAGVHNTTVSLSLRNSRLIPSDTRKRIQAIAEEMGYAPDPALRALAAYRSSLRAKQPANPLAYITNWETKWGWREQAWHRKYFLGAQRKAAELGYQLEHFWLGEAGMSQRRLSDMLLHRGINGVILASNPPGGELSEINWSRLSAVKIGCFPHVPALNQVAIDQGSLVNLLMRRINLAGYQRVGFLLSRYWDDLVGQSWSKAFFAEQYVLPARERLPILYLGPARHDLTPPEDDREQPDDAPEFSRWYRDHQPEVIVGLAPQALRHLERQGLVVPRDVAFVDLFLDESGGDHARVRPNCERVGELAVEILAGQLRENEFGVPSIATMTSVSGEWVDGMSLPPAGTPAGVELALSASAMASSGY